MSEDDAELVVAQTSSGAEELSRMVPEARIVAAFNTVPSEVLFGVFEFVPAKRLRDPDARAPGLRWIMVHVIGECAVDRPCRPPLGVGGRFKGE